MNISKNTRSESERKKTKNYLLGRIEGRETGTSRRLIKTTAKILFFCLFLYVTAGLLCPAVFKVYADVPIITKVKTMAELILTLTAGAGTVITQPTVVNPIITEFGSADFTMQNLVDNGAFNLYDKTTGQLLEISTETAIDHIADKEWLEENNAEFKMDYQEFSSQVSAADTLAKNGANLIHQAALQTGNPMEWDWGELIQTYLNQGQLSYELLFTDYTTGNTIIEDMAGILDNIVSFWTGNIENGQSIEDVVTMPSGYSNYSVIKGPRYTYIFYYNRSDGIYLTSGYISGTRYTYVLNLSGNRVNYRRVRNDGNSENLSISQWASSQKGLYESGYLDIDVTFSDQNAIDAYIQSVRDGQEEVNIEKYSPDLVNPILGNLSAEDLENLSPSIETGQAILPVDQDDYLDMMDEVNDNTNNDTPEDNPAVVYPFIQNYIVNENQSNPNPDDPNRPVIPDQPTIPEKEPITDQEMEENLAGTTVGLEEVFPFCIPFDIVKLIKGLRAERKAPVIDWTFESELFGFSHRFYIDLSEFNDVAAILRTMELIVFIIGLAVATRKLIGAGG